MKNLFGGTGKAFTEEQSRRLSEIISLFILALAVLFSMWLFRHLLAPRMDFYNELWAPAYLLVHGQSPYDTASLNPNLPAAWFPMSIGFFFSLGWLPETLALQVWFVLNFLDLCVIIYWSQGGVRRPGRTFVLALFCFFFPPVLNHLFLGQISIAVMLSLLLATCLVEKERHWPAALFVALALSKPHLAVLPVMGLSLYEFRRGGWAETLSLWGRVLVMSLALCIPLFVAEPNWIPDAIASMTQNPYWSYPSLFVVYQRYFSGWEYGLWGLTFLVLVTANAILWFKLKLPLRSVIAWSLALAPLASPYVGSWDFVVLLPLFFIAFVNSDGRRRIFLAIGYVLAWLGMAMVQMQPSSDNHFFWWVPLWFVGIVALITDWKKISALYGISSTNH